MKKLLEIILVAALISIVISSAQAAAGSGIEVTVPKYEPFPVEPGEYFDLWVKVQNVGNNDISNANIKVIPSYPFSFDITESDARDTGVIRGGQEEIFKFKVRVDEKAIEGTNTIKIEYSFGSSSKVTEDYDILVQTRDAILGIVEINRMPESFVPGEISTLEITLENMADSVLTDVVLNLDLSNDTIPFTTLTTASERSIYLIGSGETKKVSFDILTFPDAESEIYKIPLGITYYDNVGTQYIKDEVVGFIVGDVPIIDLLLDKTTITQSGTAGTVTFEIINKGLADIKFLSIELQDTEDFEIISPAKLYIGELDSDDTDSFDMRIYVDPTSESGITLPVHLQYLDNNNKEYDMTENVQLNLYSKTEISKYGLGDGGSAFSIVVMLVILAGTGWFVYNRWFKKR